MYQLAHYVKHDGSGEYVVIFDTDGDEDDSHPDTFIRNGFLLQELVDVPSDLSGFPVGYELRKV